MHVQIAAKKVRPSTSGLITGTGATAGTSESEILLVVHPSGQTQRSQQWQVPAIYL